MLRIRIKRISRSGDGVEPGNGVARLTADGGEIAARQNVAVRLYRDCADKAVRVRIERISRAGCGVKPGDEIARRSADGRRAHSTVEIAARYNLAVCLYHD